MELARAAVAEWCGAGASVAHVSTLGQSDVSAAVLITLAHRSRRLVLKIAAPYPATLVDFARTAAAMSLARDAGVPVPESLGVDSSRRLSPWQCLLLEHVPGLEWFRVRPQLDQARAHDCSQQIAAAVLAVQSVRLASFGELDRSGQPAPTDLVTALRHRAERIADLRRRDLFLGVLDRDSELFEGPSAATLSHDDLHPGNLVWRRDPAGWRLAAVIDWDKAWAGPTESDVARLSFWDGMTGPGFWEAYRAAVPEADREQERALIYQLLWCLEYEVRTPRHLEDTARLCRRLGLVEPA